MRSILCTLTFYENIAIKNMLPTLTALHDWLIVLLMSAAKNANCILHHIKRHCYNIQSFLLA